MKNLIKKFVAISITTMALYGAAPVTINYQGYLKDSSGNAITGTKSIVFSLYTASSGGSAIWTSTKSITVTDGIYSTVLGDSQVLTGLDFDAQYYLGINVASDGEMTPRQPLTSTAYAIKSTKTEQVGTLTSGKWCSSDGSVVNCSQDAPMLKTTYDTDSDGKVDMDKLDASYTFPTGDGTSGQVLKTDGSGSVTWQDDSSGGGGSSSLTVTTLSANTTLTTDDQFVVITGAYEVKLPASPATGQKVILLTRSGSATLNLNGKTLYVSSAYTDYGTTLSFTAWGMGSMTLIYDGSQWYLTASRNL